jgi:hypothetical protein
VSGTLQAVLLLVAAAAFGLFVVIAGVSEGRARRRRARLRELALVLNLDFAPEQRTDIAKRFDHLKWLGNGFLSVCHVIAGQYKGRDVLAFDAWGEYHQFKQPVNFSMSVIVVTLASSFPGLEIMAEKLVDKVTDALEDIDFENHEFSRRFLVKCPDRKFAYAVISARMMAYLLAHPGYRFEMRGPSVLMFTGSPWTPEQYCEALEVFTGFLDLIPGHVLKDYVPTDRPEASATNSG